MAWNEVTGQFDDPRPAYLHAPATNWSQHHRIPWGGVLRPALNDIVRKRLDMQALNALLALSPASAGPLVAGFKAAVDRVAAGLVRTQTNIAALEAVEAEIFSLPCNLFLGPGSGTRLDNPGADPDEMDFLGNEIDGEGLIRDNLNGRLQRIRERAMSALMRRDVQGLKLATADWTKFWTAPAPEGFGRGRDTYEPFDRSLWAPLNPPPPATMVTPTYRLMSDHAGALLTAAQSLALNGVVIKRVRTKYSAVFQIVERAPAAPPVTPAPVARKIQRYGWRPDLPDHRDRSFALGVEQTVALPPSVDLRPGCPPVYNQGSLGSCTGNAIAAAIHFDRLKQALSPDFVPSRLFIYYNERVIENTIDVDAGAQIRDGIKSVGKAGVCTETDWPYLIEKFAVRPPDGAFSDALGTTAVLYERLDQNLTQMKGCLAAGFPFVFGFSVYSSFEDPRWQASGLAPMPAPADTMIGGHAVLAVGYDDADDTMLVRNSWGPGWGLGGYFKLPYAYIESDNLAADFWTIRIVGAPPTS